MARTNELEMLITSILEELPITRNSNKELINEVYKRSGFQVSKCSFEDMVLAMPIKFETITRIRRKIQEKREDLRADDAIKKYREELQYQYWKYAHDELVEIS